MASDVDKAFNESMRRIMGPDWKPSPSVSTKPRTVRAKTYSNKDNKKGNMKRVPKPFERGGSMYNRSAQRGRDIEATDGDKSRGRDEFGRLKYYKTKKGKKPSEMQRILRFRGGR